MPPAAQASTAPSTWAALDQLLKSLPPSDWRTGDFLDATDSDTSRIGAILILSIDSLARRRDAGLTADDLQNAVRRLRRAGYFRILRALLLRQYATSIARAIPGTQRQPENDALYDGLCPPRKKYNSRSGAPRPKDPHRPDETRITQLVRDELKRRKLGEAQTVAVCSQLYQLYRAVANQEGCARSTARQATETQLPAIPGGIYWKEIMLPAPYVLPRDTLSTALSTLAGRGAVLLAGAPGSGKTQLAICLLQQVCRLHDTDGWYILATRSADALQSLHSLRKLAARPLAVVLDLSDRADAGVREVMDALRRDERFRGRLIIAAQDEFMSRPGMHAAEWQDALCRVPGLNRAEMCELLETMVGSLPERLPTTLSELQYVTTTGAQRLQFPLDAEWFVREELAAVIRSERSLDEAIARSKRASERASYRIAEMPVHLQRAVIAACVDHDTTLATWPTTYGELEPTLAVEAPDLVPRWWSELHWLFQKTGERISVLDTYRNSAIRAMRRPTAERLAREVLDLTAGRLLRKTELPALDIVASAALCDPARGRSIAEHILRSTKPTLARARSIWFNPDPDSLTIQFLPSVREALALTLILRGTELDGWYWLIDLIHELLRDGHHVAANALWEDAGVETEYWDLCLLATVPTVFKGFPEFWNVGLADVDRHHGALEILQLGERLALAPVVRDGAGKPIFVGAPRTIRLPPEGGVAIGRDIELGVRLLVPPEEQMVYSTVVYRNGAFGKTFKIRQLQACGSDLIVILTTDRRIQWASSRACEQLPLESIPTSAMADARCYRFLATEFLPIVCRQIAARQLGQPEPDISYVIPVDDPKVRRVERTRRRPKRGR